MADEITTEDIVTAALAPQSLTVDGMTVSERPVADLIAAERHVANKAALANGKSAWGRRIAKAVPPGGGPH